tara:strand:- start:585 stop:1190 length:606 start_codon:yes stop_codon:yes gene_type:complete
MSKEKTRSFQAYCKANVIGYEARGLKFAELNNDTNYVVVIPTHTETYAKTIKSAKLLEGFKSVEKGEVANSYTKYARGSEHMVLRDHFNGHGDCVIAKANGKLLKQDKQLLTDAEATVCMTEQKYSNILKLYDADSQLAKLENASYSGNNDAAKADKKRFAMSVRRVVIFAEAMKHKLVFEMPKAKAKKTIKIKQAIKEAA